METDTLELEAIASLLRKAKDIVVFSGAGLSADSGIPTFRDSATGLWNNVDPDEVASIDGFLRRPQLVWNWLLQLKHLIDECSPNPGHLAIAQLENLCRDKQLTVITQNIDGYHARAGNAQVLEVHGTIHQVRCHRRCGFRTAWEQTAVDPYPCPHCGAPVRPDLVLFGEMLDEEVFAAAEVRSLNAAPHSPCSPPHACLCGPSTGGRRWSKSIPIRRRFRKQPIIRYVAALRSSSQRSVRCCKATKRSSEALTADIPRRSRRREAIGYNARLASLAGNRAAPPQRTAASRTACRYPFFS